MARYDRIARLDLPPRADTFAGWLTLRDLDGREREPELGRRARLRFLAVRPLHRLLQAGLREVDVESFDQQIEAVREELSQLPSRDPERERLESYLTEIGGRSPGGLVSAALEVGGAAEAGGCLYAAEEFYRTALALARRHELGVDVIVALRFLGRVQREREEWGEAAASLQESALLAAAAEESAEWARSMEALAAVQLRRGDAAAARSTLREIDDRLEADRDEQAAAIAASGRCALELAEGNEQKALEAGWAAIRALPAGDEARNGVLLNMAAAFRRLGLQGGAASCYRIVRRWAAWPEHRIEAEMELAIVAAESGDAETFGEQRTGVVETLGGVDRPLKALLDLGLARGALLIGDHGTARDHVREAISTARDLGADAILEQAEGLLDALEGRRGPEEPARTEPSSKARLLAQEIGALEPDRVAAG